MPERTAHGSGSGLDRSAVDPRVLLARGRGGRAAGTQAHHERTLDGTGALTEVALFLIRGYRLVISPLFPPSCRYTPTCSAYTLEAVERHGAWRGLGMGMRRVTRCHPWHDGGYDPVP